MCPRVISPRGTTTASSTYLNEIATFVISQGVLPTVHLLGGVGQFENFAPSIRASQDLIE